MSHQLALERRGSKRGVLVTHANLRPRSDQNLHLCFKRNKYYVAGSLGVGMRAVKAPLPGTVCGGGVSGCRRWDDACAARDSVPFKQSAMLVRSKAGIFLGGFFCRGGFSHSNQRKSLAIVSRNTSLLKTHHGTNILQLHMWNWNKY